MRRLIVRVASAGALAALLVGVVGWTLERARFGASDRDAVARVEREVRERFERSAATLEGLATQVASDTDSMRAAGRDPAAARRLFDDIDRALARSTIGRTGITVYNSAAAPLAWGGRVSELPHARINGPRSLFVAAGALGPRLVRVQPVGERDPRAARLAAIVAEQVLGEPQPTPGRQDAFIVPTSIAPVSLRARVGAREVGPAERRGELFVIPSEAGGALVEAEVQLADIASARARWRETTRASVLSVLGVTLLLCAAPLIERRHRPKSSTSFLVTVGALAATLVSARVLFLIAARPLVEPQDGASPFDLLLTCLMAAGLVWLLSDVVERVRLSRPRLHPWSVGSAVRVVVGFMIAGLLGTLVIASYERLLQTLVSHVSLDVLHFSLHPLNAARLSVAFALLLLHAAVIWGVAVFAHTAGLWARTERSDAARLAAVGSWLLGTAVAAELAVRWTPPVPPVPLLVAASATGFAALALTRLRARARRASQATRLLGLFFALLAPAVAMYPSLVTDATDAKERLVATDYAPQALRQRDELQERLRHALEQIDRIPSLGDLVVRAGSEGATTDRAFAVWSQTDLATHRITSAVELYGAGGELVSRFALNLPEYQTPAPRRDATCEWDLIDEVSPLGSSVRHVLRATRGVCAARRVVGTLVVRAMFDFRALPFISAQEPYLESLQPTSAPPEGAPGRDVEFAVYGWSRAPIYASGTRVWPLPDDVFEQTVRSRTPFWATLVREGEQFRVYFASDRGGIYALGYPVLTAFDHVINLAELVTLAMVLYAALLVGATLLNALTSRTPASGRALWREFRSSFYRKLLGAFVVTAVAPVVILAFATRTYFATQARAGIDEQAVRTATIAQRLVEDYATIQQRGPGALDTIDDQIMVLVSQAIEQDVSLFNRARLQATSERDLFESGLLTTRTPGDVYRQIVIDRLPTFVGDEEIGDHTYLLAAAPVRAGDREGIVTAPLPLRQREIEQQIDELDRRVVFAAVLFSLLGALLGYWMAERIADPVNRLTRATRRIARGDLDARIAVRSSDELRRLVEDFNRMAADLKRQRTELERTQRLEAWADMARQVAHDIKNPLTPIQLSAEHALRFNVDRGRPLSPVIDDCVSAILTQVRLLRQLSAEFSSFASSPTPRPEPTDVNSLVEEVIAPYRAALAGRVALKVALSPGLPRVLVDRTLLGRALTNVIENALHAMPGGGKLTVGSRPAVGGVDLQVVDTGVGMDADDLVRIFEPYFSTKATGTGLGLTIAKRNVELNGGTIGVESARGAGTTVTIRLPVP